MIYLAVPIKHPDPKVVSYRVSIANQLDQDRHAPELIKWNHAPVPCLTELLKIAA